MGLFQTTPPFRPLCSLFATCRTSGRFLLLYSALYAIIYVTVPLLFLLFCDTLLCQNAPHDSVLAPPGSCAKMISDSDRAVVLAAAQVRRQKWPPFEPVALFHAQGLGIRRLTGRHVDFYTDLPSTPETDGMVEALDRAVPLLCRYFSLPESAYESWRIEAFLMNEREPFEIFGALTGAPEFPNGYSLYNRIWVFDKKQGYYNRFLLLHELVHAFMDETFGSLEPRWYSEGIAEFLALHSWDGQTLTLGVFPENAEQVAGFGRIDRIRTEAAKQNIAAPTTVFGFKPDDYEDVVTYAWSWAMVTLLAHDRSYADFLAAMPYLMTRPDPTAEFLHLSGADATLGTDWADFVTTIDYGYDFDATRLDYAPGVPLGSEPVILELAASGGGWQNSRIALQASQSIEISASGRFRVGYLRRKLPCEANGITIRYVNGRPLGTLLATVIANPADGALRITPIGTGARLTAEKAGTLYFRLNLPPGEIDRAEGTLQIKIRPTSEKLPP